MAAKHKAEGTDSLSEAAKPPEPQPVPQTADEAVAIIEAGLGPVAWKREYRPLPEGGFLDVESGELLDSIPTGDPYAGPAT